MPMPRSYVDYVNIVLLEGNTWTLPMTLIESRLRELVIDSSTETCEYSNFYLPVDRTPTRHLIQLKMKK
jgi:hypothetical protein